jgi:hypothetical protein
MGCDYYIIKVLEIYYSENEYFETQIDRERGYFNYDRFDEDDDNYEENIKSYKKSVLTPQMSPILIYNNGKFNKPITEAKYKFLIEEILMNNGKKWSDVIKIMKVEIRYER